MSPYKGIIILVLMSFITGECLEEIQRQDNSILETEAIIRSTINSIFLMLKLKRIHERPKIQEYTTLHKYFVSLSLQDDHNLKKILKLTKVNNERTFYNGSDFIAIINEIINEDKIHRTDLDDFSVIKHCESFITGLNKLKEKYAPKTIYVNINFKVLEHLKNAANQSFKIQKSDVIISKENEFWEPSGRRIYKGQRTKIKYYPFMASVHIFNNFHCAGSIIKSDLIITASSCLQLAWNNRLFRENPAFLSVRVGSSFYSGGGELIPVLEIYFHPGYDPKSLQNNLCIVRLVRRLNFRRRNKRVKRIDIDRNPWNLPMTTPGVIILGWGAKGSSGIVFDPWKNILSVAILDVYPLPDCRDVYSRQYVTRKHFCAGFLSKGGGACNRDVGAPGVVDGKLMGVVSFGSPTCGTPDAPTVFTKLGHYTDWIEDVMEKPVPVSLKRTTEQPLKDKYNFIPMKEPTATTFRIPPLTGKKLDPISIHDIDNTLRHVDENLFKEFISTMFSSSEIDKYQDIIRQQHDKVEENIENKTETDLLMTTPSDSSNDENDVVFVTKILDFDDDSANKPETTELKGSESEKDDKHTSKVDYQETNKREQSQESYRSDEYKIKTEESEEESNIIQFMKHIDLKKIIQEEVNITPKTTELYPPSEMNNFLVKKIYHSDTDKTTHNKHTKFHDMTRSKPKSTNGTLPVNEVYSLLSDVIEEEIQNKLVKGSM